MVSNMMGQIVLTANNVTELIVATLKSGVYDKTVDYYLILMDSETEMEYSCIPFQINIAINNDFDDFF